MTTTLPPKKKGFVRITAAFFYSLDGLRSAITGEAAFRQELFLFLLLLPVLFYLPISNEMKALLFLANTIVGIVELLNTGIEAVVDMASPGYHKLAKQAKDMGSAAVLISLLMAFTLWCYTLITTFFL